MGGVELVDFVGGGGVFLGDGAVCDAGVDEGHAHRSVPQHRGHGFEAHAVVDRLRRERVTHTNAAVAARFDRRRSVAGEPYFVLIARNGESIGRSEVYSSTSARENRIRSVQTNAPTARVDDLTD